MPKRKQKLSIWDGDGLPDYDDWADIVIALDMTTPEQEAWIDACKSEAWVREKTAKHENKEWNLAVARYFWRRAEKLREYHKRLTEGIDQEIEEQKPGAPGVHNV